MGEERFRAVDKIKTIGSTYMAAVGLIPEFKIADDKDDGGLSAVTYLSQVRTRQLCVKSWVKLNQILIVSLVGGICVWNEREAPMHQRELLQQFHAQSGREHWTGRGGCYWSQETPI